MGCIIDRFNYVVTNGDKESTAEVLINVESVNDAPIAVDDSVSVIELLTSNIYSGLLANDIDVDGDNLQITSVDLEQYTSQGNLELGYDDGSGYLMFNPSTSFSEVKEFTYTISDGNGGFDTATVTIDSSDKLNIINGTNYNDCAIEGSNQNDIIYGHKGNDTMTGNHGNDILYGGEGIDCMNGGCGDDIMIGGTGSDYMNGGCGNDTYIFNLGDGEDTVCDGGTKETQTDVISFGEGINHDDIALFMDGEDLIIQYSEDDNITIKCQNMSPNIEKISFSDGSYMTNIEIDTLIQSINAYASEKGMALENVHDVRRNNELMSIVSSAWHS